MDVYLMARITFFVAIGVVILFATWGKKAFDRSAAASLGRIRASAERGARNARPTDPVVAFSYHTYQGLLLYVVQQEHRMQLPYSTAEETLSSLLRHTMRYGCFAYGALIIPGLAYLNYLGQRRSIRKQRDAAPAQSRRRA